MKRSQIQAMSSLSRANPMEQALQWWTPSERRPGSWRWCFYWVSAVARGWHIGPIRSATTSEESGADWALCRGRGNDHTCREPGRFGFAICVRCMDDVDNNTTCFTTQSGSISL